MSFRRGTEEKKGEGWRNEEDEGINTRVAGSIIEARRGYLTIVCRQTYRPIVVIHNKNKVGGKGFLPSIDVLQVPHATLGF